MNLVRFGLIVTGRGEADFLPNLFRTLMESANCYFEVIRKSEQLSPITSEKRILKMVGKGKRIPSKDEEQFGLPASSYLNKYEQGYVIVIDDLEKDRRSQVVKVFARYRSALDEVLNLQGLSSRASVHFLVNMVEAYYFAHSQAVNEVAGSSILEKDHQEDVESIPHPKGDLKKLWNGFRELDHGKEIVRKLDLDHILSHPEYCCWLRTLYH